MGIKEELPETGWSLFEEETMGGMGPIESDGRGCGC